MSLSPSDDVYLMFVADLEGLTGCYRSYEEAANVMIHDFYESLTDEEEDVVVDIDAVDMVVVVVVVVAAALRSADMISLQETKYTLES